MNTQLSSALRVITLASTLVFLPSFASAKSEAAKDPSKSILTQNGSIAVKSAGPYVEIGTYKIQVLVKLGQPSKQLPDGTWLYDSFNVDDSDASGPLVVRFEKGQVSSLTIVTPAVALAMTTPARPATNSRVAGNK